MHAFGNRRDIDGLRALAVIPVVLFHFGFGGLSGGFVGVDVFFVISGFLITSIIVREITAERFSFVDFWARRARRIIPALTVVILATMALGWLLLSPKDFSELGRTVRYQAMFASNILFLRQDGYFDSASEFKPLLHTWSLAVEEQYYVSFPLIMVLLTRYLRHWRWMLFGLLILSFGLNVWAIERKPDAAFFLLPMRAWELVCGAMLAVAPRPSRQLPQHFYQLAGVAGLGAVLLAMFMFDKSTEFPGWAALLPVLGATAMIWGNSHPESWVARLLSLRPLVWIGLISYSLYLWHWPVYVYANAVSVDGISAAEALLWISVAVVLAWFNWRFVEQPFRRRQLFAGRKPILVAGLVAMLVLALTGQTIRALDGLPQRMSGQAQRYAESREWKAGQMDCLLLNTSRDLNKVCRAGGAKDTPPLQVVWGDSHAAALWPALQADASDYASPAWLVSMSGCPPITSDAPKKGCQAFNDRTMEWVGQQKVPNVILAARWSLYIYGLDDGNRSNVLHKHDTSEQNEQYFAETLKSRVASLRAQGAQVWLFKEVPQQHKGTIARLSSLARVGKSAAEVGVSIDEHRARQRFISELFDEMSMADSGVHVIDPAPLMCAQGKCRAEVNGHSLYKDEDHLSDLGGQQMRPLFVPVFIGGRGN